ncbi:MAG: YwbE family protein [Bacteroidia bacterium]
MEDNRHCFRENLDLHLTVDVVTKRDQKTGALTRGRIRWFLTSKPYHSRGIKVMLEDRTVGRVQRIIDESIDERNT